MLIFGNLNALIPVQMTIMAFAIAFLALEFLSLSRSFLATMVFVLTLTLNSEFIRYAFTVLSEGLFFPLGLIWLGVTIAYLRKPTVLAAASLGCVTALLLLVRSAAIAWLPCLFLVLLRDRVRSQHQFVQRCLVMLGPLIFGLAVANAVYHRQIGNDPGASELGTTLIGKVAFVPTEGAMSSFPTAATRYDQLMAVPRSLLRTFPSAREKFLFSSNFYDYIRYRHGDELRSLIAVDSGQTDGRQQTKFALMAISYEPLAYLKDVVVNFRGLWFLWGFQSHAFFQGYNKRLEAIRKFMPNDLAMESAQFGHHSWLLVLGAVLATRFLLYCSFAISVIAMIWSCGQIAVGKVPSRLLFLLGVSGLLVNSYFLVTAMLQAALVRYSMAAWPLHCMLILGSISWGTSKLTCLRARSTPATATPKEAR
jgi:hypothetical protein